MKSLHAHLYGLTRYNGPLNCLIFISKDGGQPSSSSGGRPHKEPNA
jgi:hypothetical protein